MSNKNIIIGIDLGTTNSCVAYAINGKQEVIINELGFKTTPSCVAFDKENRSLIGQIAIRQPHSVNFFYETKRLIGRKYDDIELNEFKKNVSYKITKADNGDAWIEYSKINNVKKYSPSQISAFILRKLKKYAEEYLNEKITQAIITVPAYFNDAQRQATKDAGKIAGLEVLRIINEPTAAALAYGFDKVNLQKKIVVYDLGGGTFDVSILEIANGVFEVLSTNGNTMLGGSDFDNKIIEFLKNEYNRVIGEPLDNKAQQRLKEAAEKAKIELSTTEETEINLPYLYKDKHLNVTITKNKLESMCEDLVKKTIEPLKKALEDAKLQAKNIDEIILVGGMTRMPLVQECVEKFFNKPLHKGINPDEVVAIGAAIQGAILRGDVQDIVLLDVTPLTLGIETAGGIMTPLIKKNTTIPTQQSQVFSTAEDKQTKVNIRVFQGERSMVNDNKFLGEFLLDGIVESPRGVPQIEVKFDLDSNGILKVTAKDKGTNKEQAVTIKSSGGLTADEIEKMLKESKLNEDLDKKKVELVKIKNEADQLIYNIQKNLEEYKDKLSEAEVTEINSNLDKLIEVKDSDNYDEIKASFDLLSKSSLKLGEIMYNNQKNNSNKTTESAHNNTDNG